jgi:hypothetical protein
VFWGSYVLPIHYMQPGCYGCAAVCVFLSQACLHCCACQLMSQTLQQSVAGTWLFVCPQNVCCVGKHTGHYTELLLANLAWALFHSHPVVVRPLHSYQCIHIDTSLPMHTREAASMLAGGATRCLKHVFDCV